mmetsp:Transcript_38992/g.78663  ORF Transcript_38992/g.78663 Transcript_38992/m.78663 type:complete len:243 (-) Transcript_38992:106-834(-)
MGKRKTGPLKEQEEEAAEPKESKKKSRFTHVSDLSYESLQSRATELESDVQQVRRGLERLKGNNTTLYGNTEAKILNNRLRKAETAYGEVQRELVKRLQQMQGDTSRQPLQHVVPNPQTATQLMRFAQFPTAMPMAPAAGVGAPAVGFSGPAVGLGAPLVGLGTPAVGLGAPPVGFSGPALGVSAPSSSNPIPAAFRLPGGLPAPAPPGIMPMVGGLAQVPPVGVVGGGMPTAPQQLLPHFG